MIERLDRGLILLYQKPLYLYAVTIIPVIFGFILSIFSPRLGQDRVFYLPLLSIHLYGLIFAIIGLTVSLVLYAQHHSIRNSLILYAITAAVILGVMSLSRPNEIRHHSTLSYEGDTYQLAWFTHNSMTESYTEYILYQCDSLGIFCHTFAEDIIPTFNTLTGQQNNVQMLIREDALEIIDFGKPAEPLYRYSS